MIRTCTNFCFIENVKRKLLEKLQEASAISEERMIFVKLILLNTIALSARTSQTFLGLTCAVSKLLHTLLKGRPLTYTEILRDLEEDNRHNHFPDYVLATDQTFWKTHYTSHLEYLKKIQNTTVGNFKIQIRACEIQ